MASPNIIMPETQAPLARTLTTLTRTSTPPPTTPRPSVFKRESTSDLEDNCLYVAEDRQHIAEKLQLLEERLLQLESEVKHLEKENSELENKCKLPSLSELVEQRFYQPALPPSYYPLEPSSQSPYRQQPQSPQPDNQYGQDLPSSLLSHNDWAPLEQNWPHLLQEPLASTFVEGWPDSLTYKWYLNDDGGMSQ
jgi:hypothetical protein